MARRRLAPLRPFVAAIAVTMLLGACSGVVPAAAPASPGSVYTGSSLPPSATPASTVQILSSPTIGPNGLRLDPSLLSVLPGSLGDLPVVESPDVESPALQDRELPKHASGYAGALVGDFGGTDWATAAVVRLQPASRTDAYYASWRSDYDTAACAQAGGVASRETIHNGAQPIDHDTCSGGVDLYLVYLREPGVIVSVTSLGPLRLGEQLVGSLQP